MDELNQQLISRVAAWLHLSAFASTTLGAAKVYLLCFVLLVGFELRAGATLERYASRHFITDLTYRLFFNLYFVALYAPISEWTRHRFPALDIQWLHHQPVWIAFPVYMLIFDFISYWVHRLQHTPFFWRFHRIHHSQEQMTFASSYRNHPIDQMVAHLITLVPLLVIGAPTMALLPFGILNSLNDATHHAQLRWHYGPLRYIFVSPIFHLAHHGREAALHDKNFAGVFSFWDFLFGTAVDLDAPPERTGVEGWQVPENFFAHLLSPFRSDAIATSKPE